MVRLEKKAKILVPEKFHWWIKIFSKKTVGKNAHQENIESYNRVEGGIYTEEGKSVSVIKRGKRGSKRVHPRVVKEGVYLTIKITSDGTGILCGEERWKEVDGAGLQILE